MSWHTDSVEPQKGGADNRRVVYYQHISLWSVRRQPLQHSTHEQWVLRSEHSPAEYHIGWLITQFEPIEGNSG